ncbi:uncharacterized protein LOC119734635 [Patiria miniata]|uniref:Integrase catalytic domain-containing protein n=1 Tax=Patiria miniata TaxID=46514 RepID=A0A914AKI4_PATMI|nr:uncharacterized protein LOC119734635 [Patiria miniata]
MNSLVGILCRFRLRPVAFMCDVEQMFHQFKVEARHRDYLRFVWWKDGNFNNESTEYRMGAHLFGAVSSPGCANFGLKQIAEDYEAKYGSDAADFVRHSFYVDDGLKSVSSTSEAVTLIRQTKEMCAQGGLRLHKFISNSREVMENVPQEDQASNVKILDLLHDALPIERALGVEWCVESDAFNFCIILRDKPLTRRGILSTICSIYDPLGFVAPVMLVGILILQDLCRVQVDWDTPLNDEMRSRWEKWRKDLPLLEKLKIPRCVCPEKFGKVIATEIHHFSDASAFAYGQCSYLRLIDDKENVHSTLIMGKSRVTPLKPITIPRLELTAAVVSVRVSTLLQKELDLDAVTEVFWTDSKVVLGYVKNESRRFHVFVANRVQQIRSRSDPNQWKHVGTKENPADEGSRGLRVEEILTSKWLKGPDFLLERKLPPQESTEYQTSPEDPEVKKTSVLLVQTVKSAVELEHFSKWRSLRRAIAGCQKFMSRLMEAVKDKRGELTESYKSEANLLPRYCPASVEDLQRSERTIIKLVQSESFPEEIRILTSLNVNDGDIDRHLARKRNKSMKRTSSLFRLDPFIDNEGILRVGGRIRKADMSFEFKHPAILPRRHHVTSLIIRHFHELAAHQGRGTTTNAIRSNGFWILGCSAAVATQISNCVRCRKLYGKVQEQRMANLPDERLQPAPPFTFSGVDYFGPWLIKEGRKELKRYGVLFTCLASRAIHIEVANSLTTDSIINALRRFTAIRGPMRVLRSDQGTNLVGARSELKRALEEMDHDRLRHFLIERGCDYPEFKMNAPTASHTGGAWERLIRSVRRVLQALMEHSGTQLDDESLRTFMCEAAAIVNSRPLSVTTLNESTALEPLTPNHLLTLKSSVVLPPPGEFQRVDVYSQKRWRRVQYLANEFWNRWKGEFVQNLQARQKWTRRVPDVQVGDVVLIVNNNLPRNQWQLGRISEAIPGTDGQVRRVKLVVADRSLDVKGKRTRPVTTLERPIQKLVVLLKSQEHWGFPIGEP